MKHNNFCQHEWIKLVPRGFVTENGGARRIFLFGSDDDKVTFPVWLGDKEGWPSGSGDSLHSSIQFARHKLLKGLNLKVKKLVFKKMLGHRLQVQLVLVGKNGKEVIFLDSIGATLPICLAGDCEYYASKSLIKECQQIDQDIHLAELEMLVFPDSETPTYLM